LRVNTARLPQLRTAHSQQHGPCLPWVSRVSSPAERSVFPEQMRATSMRCRTRRNSMSAKTKIAAAAVAVFVAPTHHSAAALLRAKSLQQWTDSAIYGACEVVKKSPSAKRSASRARISQAADPPTHVLAPDGRDLGTDPDPSIRFQLRRDSSAGM